MSSDQAEPTLAEIEEYLRKMGGFGDAWNESAADVVRAAAYCLAALASIEDVLVAYIRERAQQLAEGDGEVWVLARVADEIERGEHLADSDPQPEREA